MVSLATVLLHGKKIIEELFEENERLIEENEKLKKEIEELKNSLEKLMKENMELQEIAYKEVRDIIKSISNGEIIDVIKEFIFTKKIKEAIKMIVLLNEIFHGPTYNLLRNLKKEEIINKDGFYDYVYKQVKLIRFLKFGSMQLAFFYLDNRLREEILKEKIRKLLDEETKKDLSYIRFELGRGDSLKILKELGRKYNCLPIILYLGFMGVESYIYVRFIVPNKIKNSLVSLIEEMLLNLWKNISENYSSYHFSYDITYFPLDGNFLVRIKYPLPLAHKSKEDEEIIENKVCETLEKIIKNFEFRYQHFKD